ncbi:rubredoxin [Dyella sp. C9]|uniref:rubredoxin n=1 Tax=Dyella sp. C9 TaxID=2202154 RepID=UPI000DEFD23A|nr:rubredoxin [Dyella sp. C9]
MEAQLIDYLLCSHCGRGYDESKGCPSTGVAAGTRWEEVPQEWRCPDCGASKGCFEPFELVYQRAFAVICDW